MGQEMIVVFILALFGAVYVFIPQKTFEWRAWLYEKIYKAKIEGSARTYLIYRILGIFFLLMAGFIYLNRFIYNEKQAEPVSVTNFEECVEAGNPVMESYPRKCAANGVTYTEIIKPFPTEEEEQVFCAQDVQECPDGSFVGRVPPDCNFASCPAE